MRALVSTAAGLSGLRVLADVPEPVPGAGEVSLRVEACAAGYPDVRRVLDLEDSPVPRPYVPGAEVAGVVTQCGAGVSAPAVGDRVMVICDHGGMAECVLAKARRCVILPSTLPMDEAAALQLTYGAALHGLRRGAQLQRGERLLVLGAAGGMGVAAVQLGKALGAYVIGAVSSAQKAQVAREAGADTTLIYPRGPFDEAGLRTLAAQFRSACGDGVNVIMDPVGGDYSEAALRSIARGGRLLVAGLTAGGASLPLDLLLRKRSQVLTLGFSLLVARDDPEYLATIDELMRLHAHGLIRPRVAARLPLARAAEALVRLVNREATGKLVILPA